MPLRCVALLRDDGRQTQIVTSRADLPEVEIAERMFARWRQENFFKYAQEEFDLDALDTYAAESDDPERTVPNPAWTRIDRELRRLRAEEETLAAELGHAAAENVERRIPTVRGFKIVHASIRQGLARVQAKMEQLRERRRALPERVPLREVLPPDQQPEKLEVERKHFLNLLKMVVYRAENALLNLLHPHYARCDEEGRALLREAFRASGELQVAQGQLRVILDPLSAPRRTQAIGALCQKLNLDPVRIPRTTLTLHVAVRSQDCLK